MVKRMAESMQALDEAGKLGAYLLQLSPAFRPRDCRLEELDPILDGFKPHPVAVEFRYRAWMKEKRRKDVFSYLSDHDAVYVSVDAPLADHVPIMPPIDAVTNNRLAYMRCHGRNERGYMSGAPSRSASTTTTRTTSSRRSPTARARSPTTPTRSTCCSTTTPAILPRRPRGECASCSARIRARIRDGRPRAASDRRGRRGRRGARRRCVRALGGAPRDRAAPDDRGLRRGDPRAAGHGRRERRDDRRRSRARRHRRGVRDRQRRRPPLRSRNGSREDPARARGVGGSARRVRLDLPLHARESKHNIALYSRIGYVEYDRRSQGDFSVVFMRKRLGSAKRPT